MNVQEQKIYKLECQLIREHFRGLKARPVKIVKTSNNFMARANEPFMEVNRQWLPQMSSQDLKSLFHTAKVTGPPRVIS